MPYAYYLTPYFNISTYFGENMFPQLLGRPAMLVEDICGMKKESIKETKIEKTGIIRE